MTSRRLLDLFCGAGGAARGYRLAGWHVTGVDHRPQPRYAGDEFVLADGRSEFVRRDWSTFDAVHASPPCHDHSTLSAHTGRNGTGWLLAATRHALDLTGLPYVIENVPGAPMRPDIVLCSEMFSLRAIRHRWFELGRWWALCPMHPPHTARTSSRKRKRDWVAGMHVSVTGNIGTYYGPEAMGIDWMTGAELAQAIPPAYTRYVGELLAVHLDDTGTPDPATRAPNRCSTEDSSGVHGAGAGKETR